MGQHDKKVSADHLKLGMFVAGLDRPWLETPFPFQGFVIKDTEELRQLENLCKYVYIDTALGVGADSYLSDQTTTEQALENLARSAISDPVYHDTVSVEEELEIAKDKHEKACELVGDFMESARKGKELRVDAVKPVVDGMVESIIRNPDAFMWLTKLKQKDAYTYSHSIDVCALAIAFGRHLGLPKDQLAILAQGALMFDVGKMRLPSELLKKPRKLDAKEYELVKRHVEFGVSILQKTNGIHKDVIGITVTHHERYNGAGYPRRLRNENIPLFGRLASIVDCYDAITSDRPYSKGLSPHDAVRKLYEWRNVDFQEELVESFIQCLGIYPTGTLVELSSGEVGIVVAQNRVRRLRPKVMLILDANKQLVGTLPTLDLATAIEDVNGNPLDIVGAVDPAVYNIDPKEYYL